NFQENFIEGDETIPKRTDAQREALRCPRCQAEYGPGELFCPACDYVLSNANRTKQIKMLTAPAPLRRVGEAFIEDRKTIVFEIMDRALAFSVAEHLSIGRLGVEPTDQAPEVDLTSFDAYAKGVSRQHLSIERERDLIYVVDQNSLNGTLLNGHRLMPNQKSVLR